MNEAEAEADRQDTDVEHGAEVEFVDAATRVSSPSAFDEWYYGIEDRLGQGTVGMGICFLIFILVLVFAALFNPI